MRLALLVVASLALSGFALVASADSAAACTPPNCPGFGSCHIRECDLSVDPSGPTVLLPVYVECNY